MAHLTSMIKFLFVSTIIFGGLIFLVWLGVRDTLTPIVRDAINKPIYAVGEAIDPAGDIQDRKIVKFGPAFWGQYPGGRAFQTVANAVQYLVDNNKVIKGWAVYQLSGDFGIDTYLVNGASYTNKSLIVIRLVKKPTIFKLEKDQGKGPDTVNIPTGVGSP